MQRKFRTQFPRLNTNVRARTRIESACAFHSVFGTIEDKWSVKDISNYRKAEPQSQIKYVQLVTQVEDDPEAYGTNITTADISMLMWYFSSVYVYKP